MKRILTVGLLVCLAFSSWVNDSHATTAISKDQQKLKQIQQNAKTKGDQLSKVLADMNKLKAEVSQVETKMDSYDSQISQFNKDLAKNQASVEKQQKQLDSRVVLLYQRGEMGYMVQLLSAKTFGQFLTRFEGIRLIVKNDSNLLSEYKTATAKMVQTKKSIEAVRAKLLPLLTQSKAKLAQIDAKTKGISNELKKIKDDEQVTKAAIAERKRLQKLASEQYKGSYGTGRLMKPAAGTITSGFGYRWGRQHEGIDMADDRGKKIWAADSGVVILAKSDPDGYGYYIVIKHSNGLSTLYAHMYRSTVRVSQGERVKKGQWIADIGNNGRSTGPHLHFEVHLNGNAVNPMPYIT
jgi:murein DD-endopeptidase MepM/ murein hydrolase activator NlpD